MPITVAEKVKQKYPNLDVRVAFERTVVNVDKARANLVSSEKHRYSENDYVVTTDKNIEMSCNVLMLTEQNSFSDPINGFALYRISEH